jgi:aladin
MCQALLHGGARVLAWRPMAGATLAVGGAHGVCVWSHGPSSGGTGGGGDGGGGGGAKGLGGKRIGGAPEWRLKHLSDAEDTGSSSASPFKSATAGANTIASIISTLRRLVPSIPLQRNLAAAAGSSGPVDALAW